MSFHNPLSFVTYLFLNTNRNEINNFKIFGFFNECFLFQTHLEKTKNLKHITFTIFGIFISIYQSNCFLKIPKIVKAVNSNLKALIEKFMSWVVFV